MRLNTINHIFYVLLKYSTKCDPQGYLRANDCRPYCWWRRRWPSSVYSYPQCVTQDQISPPKSVITLCNSPPPPRKFLTPLRKINSELSPSQCSPMSSSHREKGEVSQWNMRRLCLSSRHDKMSNEEQEKATKMVAFYEQRWSFSFCWGRKREGNVPRSTSSFQISI